MYRCDETLLEFLVVNRGAGQTRKAFAKKTVLIGFPNIQDIRLTGTRQKKCRRQGWWFLGGGGGRRRGSACASTTWYNPNVDNNIKNGWWLRVLLFSFKCSH